MRAPDARAMTAFRVLGAVTLATTVLSACANRDDVTVIKLGHGLDVTHPVHRAMEAMAADVAERSSGRMRIDLYPSEQLGTERQLLELLQIGSVGMTKVSAAVLENFAPEFLVLSLPYIFRDEAHHFAVLDGPIGRELLSGLVPYRLRGMTFYDAGSRSFYTKDRPVDHPDDLAGLKLRTQESATAMELVRRLGASPTPIAWGELYSALQQGIVDGAENNPPSFHLSGHYEIARYYSLDMHTRVPDVLVVSMDVWSRLSEVERGWLTEAVTESTRLQRVLWRVAVDEALAAVEAAGVQVLRPDPAPFAQQVEGMFDAYRSEPVIYDLIARIRSFSPEGPYPDEPN
ncbi:MAG: TRAP transporter substrate-binding protein [Gemmatimonadota bacterium]